MGPSNADVLTGLPDWVPTHAKSYLAHTEAGVSIRELARRSGCHASTILRQIRKFEVRRDDPLVDAALRKLSDGIDRKTGQKQEKGIEMSATVAPLGDVEQAPDVQDLVRVLRRMCERGAVLAVASDMEKAVIVRESDEGHSTRTAVVERQVAETLALREWISAARAGRVTRYRITTVGRQALERMLSPDAVQAPVDLAGSETPYADQHRDWGEKSAPDPETGRVRKFRYNLAESPLTALARRRDKDGTPFLEDALVSAGERLREDFELAQMGPRVAQNWDRFLTGGARGGFASDSGIGNGPEAARKRVAEALAALGPGLGDVALRCCCYLEGLEVTEKRLGWSARSGKIVLRIALMQLRRHYEETLGPGGGMIG